MSDSVVVVLWWQQLKLPYIKYYLSADSVNGWYLMADYAKNHPFHRTTSSAGGAFSKARALGVILHIKKVEGYFT